MILFTLVVIRDRVMSGTPQERLSRSGPRSGPTTGCGIPGHLADFEHIVHYRVEQF